ncbi:RNA polymerase subunit sigma [Sporosarcina sp. NCCP-2222]|uniref:sigma-70 family RNA polymerase sigma factor n=1 Tax=Sporosarcina sp. NCCP-2222 TaxID=2935073 RepID=UPI00208AB99F|nr:sigma-70 family RNA polymerase sigma factor [Sporosarcina sp. NCCP-2222]GKV56573.1 RNA polymerase subunit sigma [Sporosarcina sp. NCCP-2222]
MKRELDIEQLMTDYGEEIKRLVYTYVKDHAATEDVTQEIFLTVYLKMDSFKGDSSVKTWIYSIAVNKCKDYLRSWHVRKLSIQENIMDLLKSSRHSPDEETVIKMENAQLVEEVLRLPVKYREVVLLYYYRDLAVREISEILQLGESAVKLRLHRGRQKLRKILEQSERSEANG